MIPKLNSVFMKATEGQNFLFNFVELYLHTLLQNLINFPYFFFSLIQSLCLFLKRL